jgi:membrane carboxypeptidase/penicillin-binding protein
MGRMDELREESGVVTYANPLTSFFYQLLRDHLPAGTVEKIVGDIVKEAGQSVTFTNGWLARYANNLADTVRNAEAINLKNSLDTAWSVKDAPEVETPTMKQAVKDEIIDSDLAAIKALVDGNASEGPDENVTASVADSKVALQQMLSAGQLTAEEAAQVSQELDDMLNNPVSDEVPEETDGRSTES